jgi:hypothetical protein
MITHSPLYAAIMVLIPINHMGAASILHHLLTLLNVKMIAMINPKPIWLIPIVRTKKTRGRLPLQIDQRMKLG